MVEGYCMKCKGKREMTGVVYEEKQTSKGVKCFNFGSCLVCGTRISATVKRKVV